MSHSSSTVHAIIDKLMPELRTLLPEVEFVHYWTDGPTSQYRNKQSFYTIANHTQIYGTDARWNFFEVGHGKGPCDGLGRTTKRMADEAVRCQKAVIQDAHDFFKWACSSNMKGVKFIFVESEDCHLIDEQLKSRNVKPVKGTFRLHAVASGGNSAVFVKDTSCYCDICLGGAICEGWLKETVLKGNENNISQVETLIETNAREMESEPITQNLSTSFNIGQFVGVKYMNKLYVGKITDTDEADDEIEISFMENKKEKFQWPKPEDVLWVPSADVLFVLQEPTASGRTGRMYQLHPSDKEKFDKVK